MFFRVIFLGGIRKTSGPAARCLIRTPYQGPGGSLHHLCFSKGRKQSSRSSGFPSLFRSPAFLGEPRRSVLALSVTHPFMLPPAADKRAARADDSFIMCCSSVCCLRIGPKRAISILLVFSVLWLFSAHGSRLTSQPEPIPSLMRCPSVGHLRRGGFLFIGVGVPFPLAARTVSDLRPLCCYLRRSPRRAVARTHYSVFCDAARLRP